MLVKTRYFGEIDLDESKVITFDNGIFGFDEYKRFTILFDSETDERPTISWLQCIDEQSLALPVMLPTLVLPEYNPIVNDDSLEQLGDWTEENISVLVTVTVPQNLELMTTNLKAPIIINTDSMKGCQVVVENTDYEIKFPIYELLSGKSGKEEN